MFECIQFWKDNYFVKKIKVLYLDDLNLNKKGLIMIV